jgi:type I restriction-modification system DNA methylase subunit
VKDLLSHSDPLEESYSRVYNALSELRESFHRTGRLDDSNAKLDEVAKLFATYLAKKKGQIEAFPKVYSPDLVNELQRAFAATVRLPQYRQVSGASIFGTQPALAIRPGDEALARDLVGLVCDCIDAAFDLRAAKQPFDILNEAFGHFVRDNFRSNVEDAQFMTPPEVVDFMVDVALHDLVSETVSSRGADRHWTVLDPTCGVGSFLATIYHRARATKWLDPRRLRLFGQDKVERMVRLSTINLELFDVEEHRITLGNSLERGSPIDHLNGTVDLILTNPPFGARFTSEYVAACGANTPFFAGLRRPVTVDSELLFVDRDLRLLRDGGRLLIVVPDGVVSAKGVAALLRHHVASAATLRAVVELPAVTFAQAGTRTKTAVLYLQKGRLPRPTVVFMGVSKTLGFQVSSRKGVQIKVSSGENDLRPMLAAYQEAGEPSNVEAPRVLLHEPSCVEAPESAVLRGTWTPNHHSASRFEAVTAIGKHPSFTMEPLRNLVEFCSDLRKPEAHRQGWAFISVLHILGEGFVDVGGALGYAPKTPGVGTEPGELLISRINPRIPRICVTPDLGVKTLCSSEFEVMSAKGPVDIYTLAYLLQTDVVQKQICSLTSGTSASHNRIRTAELAQVLVPVPRPGTQTAESINAIVRDYRAALFGLSSSATSLATLRAREADVFAV